MADTKGYLKGYRGGYGDNPSALKEIDLFFEFRDDYIRERAQNELLAYIKDGRPVFNILAILEKEDENGGLYDYYKRDESICPIPEDLKIALSPEEINEIRLKHRKRYMNELRRAIITVSELEEIGFDRDYIVGLFQAEDMKYWPKIYKRLQGNENFRLLMAEKAQKKLGDIKNRISKLTGLIEALAGRTYLEKFFKMFDPKSRKTAGTYKQEIEVLESRQRFLEKIIESSKKREENN